MKRMHIHVGVENIEESVRFYSALFDAEPIKVKEDYAKWMLDNPCVNFAISTRVGEKCVDHLGIQVDDISELEAFRTRITDADIKTHSDGETTCCYAKSEKSWIEDPNGIAWEAYHTMGDAQVFSDKADKTENACCVSETTTQSSCKH